MLAGQIWGPKKTVSQQSPLCSNKSKQCRTHRDTWRFVVILISNAVHWAAQTKKTDKTSGSGLYSTVHCGSAVHHRTETGKSWQWNLRPTSWPKRHKQNDQVLNPNELEDQVDLGQSLQVRPQTLEALRHLEKNSKVGLPATRHLVWFAKELSLPPGCKPQPPQQCLKIGPGLASHIFATSTLLWKVQPTPFWERKGCVQWWYA